MRMSHATLRFLSRRTRHPSLADQCRERIEHVFNSRDSYQNPFPILHLDTVIIPLNQSQLAPETEKCPTKMVTRNEKPV